MIALVGIASLAVACAGREPVTADKPSTSAPPATSANTAVVTATGATPTPAPAAAGAAATPAVAGSSGDPVVDQSLVKRGYRPRVSNGQVRYCKSEELTGTHFSNTVCLTADQIKTIDRNTQSQLDSISRPGQKAQ